MAMSASLHTSQGNSFIEVYKLNDCDANVVKIEDADFNQVAMFMTLEQMQELSDKIQEYVKLQGGNK